MGMQVRLVLYAADEAAARPAAAAGFAQIERLDGIFSDYRNDSELTRLNARAGTGPIVVSDELRGVLERSLELARRTDGAFDVTAGPLTVLWRRAIRTGRLPEKAAIRAASRATGVEKIRLPAGNRTVELVDAGMRLDLGAIAKGFILDAALAEIRATGIRRALIEAGGDIVAGSPPPGAPGWVIEVANVAGGACEVGLYDGAISTSGDAEQFVQISGVRYSHTVDPRSGLGLTSRISATVIGPDGITTDGLATALTILDTGEHEKLLRAYPGTRAIVRRLGGDDPEQPVTNPMAPAGEDPRTGLPPC